MIIPFVSSWLHLLVHDQHDQTGLTTDHTDDDLALSRDSFVTVFVGKVSKLCLELATGFYKWIGDPFAQSGSFVDSFGLLALVDIARILKARKPSTCSLDSCPSWLVKSCHKVISSSLRQSINTSVSQGCFPAPLRKGLLDIWF